MAPQKKKARGSGVKARQDITDSRRVLETIKQVKDGTFRVTKSGRGGKYLVRRTLRPSGFKLLLEEELAKPKNQELLDYFNGDEFRFDYTHRPSKDEKQLVIHLPSPFQTGMVKCMRKVLSEWLENIATGKIGKKGNMKNETMRVAGEISSSLSTKVHGDRSKHEQFQPDLSYTYRDSVVPDLAIDVVWSGSDLNLRSRAGHYMESEDGPVQTIVGLDMADIYDGSRHATFSIWRAKRHLHEWVWDNVVPPTEFIDGNGEPKKGSMLVLSTYDFIGLKKAGKCKVFEKILLGIDAPRLHIMYKVAFSLQLIADAAEKLTQVTQDANESLEEVIGLEQIIAQGQITGGNNQGTVIGEEELANAMEAMSQLEDDIARMRAMMQGAVNMIDKVKDGVEKMPTEIKDDLAKLEKRRAELESTVVDRETKLAKAKAAMQSVVGVKARE